MKVQIFMLLVALCVSLAIAEIEPRFPGQQPIRIPGAPGSVSEPIEGNDQFEDKQAIDSFGVSTSPPVVILLESAAPPTVTATSFDSGSSIIGGERDIILTAEEGREGLVFSAGASSGSFNVATAPNARGSVVIQYDGQDGSANLDSNLGLRGRDLTQGSAIGFRIQARADIETQFEITVTDSDGNVGDSISTIPAGDVTESYFIPFSSFESTVNFASINAIEIRIEAFDNVDAVIETFVTYGNIITSQDCLEGVILPCETNYYRLEEFTNVQPGDYVSITFEQSNNDDNIFAAGNFYIVASPYEDLQNELASNNIIGSTLGELPGPDNYDYTCDENCDIEIVWSQLENATYYLAVSGHGDGELAYRVCLAYRSVPVYGLSNGVPQTVFLDQRPTYPPDDNVLNYRFYTIDIPEESFSEGTYLVVNISRAEPLPGVGLQLMYENLPIDAVDTGIIGQEDFNSEGLRMDDLIFEHCVDLTTVGRPSFDRPISSDPRVPCECFTEAQQFGAGPSFQLTCQLVVDPCNFKYGRWYMAVELPERDDPYNALDRSGETNYTIVATTISPPVTELIRNVTFKAFVQPEAYAHFRIDVPANTIVPGESHMMVHLSNVRGGVVDLFIHQGLGVGRNLAGGVEACVPANATCRTGDACNLVIEKCHFAPGTWYISVAVAREDDDTPLVNDISRLPITFTMRANWMEDAAPQRLVAGIPVSKYVGEALYDFYVIDVPPTIDTWLFIELYAAACDTEVIMSVLHGDLPGGECYHRPDFYCITGDPRGLRVSSGTPSFLDNEPVQRESCTFMIQTCELTPGPLFISVYGHHTGYPAYGDNTFYQVPVQYTLWADFDVALSIQSGVSYSETVFERQYQHYYIRADQVQQGSSLSVEITNIQHGVPQTIEAFINYNYLAGNCPCYDHLYNCTGAVPCAGSDIEAIPDMDSVLNCCTMIVPASDFRPGVWYIAVLGMNEDYFSYTTPIGYTLTATIHDAPQFTPLLLGQVYQGEVPQWNKTLEYSHFRIGAEALPLNDLVLKATFVQNCDFMGKTDDTRDSLWMYVNKGAPATHYLGGYEYKCQVNTTTQSYCTIVVPHCEWSGDDWFVAIQGKYEADFIGRFTLRASVDAVRDYRLTSGVSHYDRVSEGRYNHYFIDTTAEEDQYLAIDLYTNQDQDMVTAYLQAGHRAGDAPCFDHMDMCETKSCCSWQLHACDLEPGRYYISVYGHPGQFYDTSVEYTITATMKPVAVNLFNGDPYTGHLLQLGDVQHYRFTVPEGIRDGSYIVFEVDNVKNGAVTVYAQQGYLAGRCPCFIWEYTCTASMEPFGNAEAEWCQIKVPSCELESGPYFFSIWAVDMQTPAAPVFNTPIGYTLEVNLITPVIIDPFVALGRDVSNTEPFQFVGDERYNHYEFSVDDDDFTNGHHVIVEITSVRDGALFVYYNQLVPGAEESNCHIAQLCSNNGLVTGSECYWQLPYCLVKPLGTGNKHYITVQGISDRVQTSYNILIYKQGVPSLIQTTADFTLDDGVADAPAGAELDILHNKVHEPNGWTQFIRLEDVPARMDEGRGEMLEVFFYRITNNPGQPLSFNVYLHPNEPAGAHECCDTDPATLASCQGAPCSLSADTTTSSNNGDDVFSHLCELGTGVGSDGNGDPLYGERCTVRIWPCEFNKYCTNNTADWYLSVVPSGYTAPESNGAGLQYSVQWQVRNIRRTDANNVGSIELNSIVNTYEYSTTYTVDDGTYTEYDGFMSFYVDFVPVNNNSRLAIQTEFTSGTGVVYVEGEEFAGPTDTCHMYMCSSGEDCDGSDRFIVSPCCAEKFERYYVTVRNTGGVGSTASVRFRIVQTDLPEPIEIDDHPSAAAPFTASSGISVYGISGVEEQNYDYYILTIDDDDLDREQSWIVDVTRPASDAGSLDVYIRFEALPGSFDEGCFGWQYHCELTNANDRCLWQIPSCDIIEGHWYIAVGNPDVNLAGTSSDLPDYTLTTYISESPIYIGVNQQYVATNVDSALIQHYKFNVTADDLELYNRQSYTGYETRYLRIQVDGLTGPATVYINYGYRAGPSSAGDCLGSVAVLDCDSVGSCYFDVSPCDNTIDFFGLSTGVYYVAVEESAGVSYRISASILRDDYTQIPLTEVIEGTAQREGVVDNLYRHTATQAELNARGDGEDNYRYIIDITGDDDDLADNEYLVFNFTAPASARAGETVDFEVFRDDCFRYECSLAGPSTWCAIDALTLGPCAAKGGRYFIRAENPSSVQFTINLWRNQTTVQRLENRETLTEIVFPYEYQEYVYTGDSLGEGATLAVEICSICGDVEAYIRPDSPAGPAAANSPIGECSIDYCRATGPVDYDTSFEPENNCCTLFLDTCEFEARDYYIGVRGVNTVFPARNEHLYLPARYNIRPLQTNVNVTEVAGSCINTVEYYTPVSDPPKQYAIDIESLNVGAMLRFSMRLPTDAMTPASSARLVAQANQTVGFSDGCPAFGDDNQELSCTTSTSCSFVVPYCKLAPYCGGRYYFWADAPRGTEIVVERYDPTVPIIHPDVVYHGSINGPTDVDFDLPFTPNHQIYRIDIDPNLHVDANFYEKFYAQVRLFNVSQGSVSFTINSGMTPYMSEASCEDPIYLNADCTATDSECYIEMTYDTLVAAANGELRDLPTTFWITVFGEEQQCELHSIKYALAVQTNWLITYFPINETVCQTVQEGEYNFHRLRPRAVETPQESILRIRIEDLDVNEAVILSVNDHFLATSLSGDGPFVRDSDDLTGELVTDYICGYDDLYMTVYGSNADGDDSAIDYRMTVDKIPVRVKDLFDDSVYHADDDDDDACPHEHDFYRFKTARPNGHHDGAFFRVLVDSEFPTQVYVNKNDFAWAGCADSGYGENDPEVTGTTSVNVYDFCDFEDGTYFITVVSEGPYYIYTDVRDDAKELTLGEVFRDELEPGMYQMYTLDICHDWFEADDRLVVEITDAQNGDVYGWIRRNGNPGNPDEYGYNTCSEESAFADFGANESGYDFMVIDHCDLNAGQYRILVRAAPHEGSPEANCAHVTFRLFPYLIDLEIDPVQITPNVPVTDSVDYYILDRIEADNTPWANYYKVHPLQEGEGYYEQISHAVVKVHNVEGGLLSVRVMCGHLATALSGYSNGEIYGLAEEPLDYYGYDYEGPFDPEHRMQSGRYPWNFRQLMDNRESRFQEGCTGCADFCGTMDYDFDIYSEDKSLAIWIPSCYFIWADFYIAVEPAFQPFRDHHVSYTLEVEQTRDYVLLQPDHHHTGRFENDNWDYDFYYSISAEPQSMRWRVVVTEGEGVLVTVRNHRCPLQSTWTKQVWCDADYFDRPWMCDLEIPTRAAHPGDNAYFVSVNGKNATYSIAFWRGRENCHVFTGSGRNEGLDFCAGLVPYGTWRWDDYRHLDQEAECFFEELYQHFRVQPCYTGVTPECNATLQAFACYESFKRCDEQGFYTGTCRDECAGVTYECANNFETVDLEHYNCSSARYVDGHSETCTGGRAFNTLDANRQFFGNEPDLLLFESSPDQIYRRNAASQLHGAFLAIFALLFVIFV